VVAIHGGRLFFHSFSFQGNFFLLFCFHRETITPRGPILKRHGETCRRRLRRWALSRSDQDEASCRGRQLKRRDGGWLHNKKVKSPGGADARFVEVDEWRESVVGFVSSFVLEGGCAFTCRWCFLAVSTRQQGRSLAVTRKGGKRKEAKCSCACCSRKNLTYRRIG